MQQENPQNENLFSIPELTRKEKMVKSRKLTTDLTKDVIKWLNDTGQFHVHRSNNFPSPRITRTPMEYDCYNKEGQPVTFKYEKVDIHFKSNNIKEAILDISGFTTDTARHIELEVKTKNDTLSDAQATRIKAIKEAGGISFVFDTMETFLFQIKPFIKEWPLAF